MYARRQGQIPPSRFQQSSPSEAGAQSILPVLISHGTQAYVYTGELSSLSHISVVRARYSTGQVTSTELLNVDTAEQELFITESMSAKLMQGYTGL